MRSLTALVVYFIQFIYERITRRRNRKPIRLNSSGDMNAVSYVELGKHRQNVG